MNVRDDQPNNPRSLYTQRTRHTAGTIVKRPSRFQDTTPQFFADIWFAGKHPRHRCRGYASLTSYIFDFGRHGETDMRVF
ncbi:hypothetical protein CLDAP_13530 [Caldilinea aerophila DSM 14535 = NBRC 104270]|uniref:Uncharacterized protein n=1 Tax=Caldilinea aerophila (strain DSM 14535 / JCM 11387 / NBRC 104270 / STL-6-O1) TaxID=926550 RepID=I0I2A5_CALAS|nr:hypothetical protein CLDAP_13530 [Caldilinea aerophila DSM 14535 = NBRC 104270]